MCVSAYATHVMQFMRLPSGLERDDGCGMAGLTALVGLVKQKLMTLPSLSKCGLVALGCLWAFVSVYVHRLSAKTARTTNKRDKSREGAARQQFNYLLSTMKVYIVTILIRPGLSGNGKALHFFIWAAPNRSQIDFHFKLAVRLLDTDIHASKSNNSNDLACVCSRNKSGKLKLPSQATK